MILNHAKPSIPSRREFLGSALGALGAYLPATGIALAALSTRPSIAHNKAGRVLPVAPSPKLQLTLHTGEKVDLRSWSRGYAVCLQLMFTTCSSLCPIQGAIFQSAQDKVGDQRALTQGMRLLSVSIDPLNDDPARMRKWLSRHEARPWWFGATPNIREVEPLLDWLDARNNGADRHTPQVYYLNRDGALALRSTDFPSAQEVAGSLINLSALGKLL